HSRRSRVRQERSQERHAADHVRYGRAFLGDRLSAGTYTVEVSASGFATSTRTGVHVAAGTADALSITLRVANVGQTVTVEAVVSVAAQNAPSQSSLDTHSAKSEISQSFIDNFTSPVSDYTEVLLMAPGTFSVNPNGSGLGDSKTYFRGFSDEQYTMS